MKLPKNATIIHAGMLASTMKQAQHIDASEIERIDTSVLQLLCAWRMSAPKSVIDRPSAPFRHAAERCGADRLLLDNFQEVA